MKKLIGLCIVAVLLLTSCFGSKMMTANGGEVTGTGGKAFTWRWKHLCLRCCAGHFLFVPSPIISDWLVNDFHQGETFAGNWRAREETGCPLFSLLTPLFQHTSSSSQVLLKVKLHILYSH